MNIKIILVCLAMALFASITYGQTKKSKKMNTEQMKELVKGVYNALNSKGTAKLEDLNFMADDFKSIPQPFTGAGKQGWLAALPIYAQLMPDLKLEIQEMLVEGNKVVVRCKCTGTPKGDFFGVPADGTKSFEIITIDIHTIEHGKLVQTYHCEDWARAMQQVMTK